MQTSISNVIYVQIDTKFVNLGNKKIKYDIIRQNIIACKWQNGLRDIILIYLVTHKKHEKNTRTTSLRL